MPITFSPGEEVRGGSDVYVVEQILHRGAFAHAARAFAKLSAKTVFLKRYFSPTISVPWYGRFKEHQILLKDTINGNPALRSSCYAFVDFFEGQGGRASKTFHQVFEFVDSGMALQQYLEGTHKDEFERNWQQRIAFATIMMMGMADLHGKKIVHTDLKPDNLLLMPNDRSSLKYSLKIIDLDWAIFSNQTAPWHGAGEGYRGTFGYMSPEHLRKQTPGEASDLFTLCIILGQLLGGRHPFAEAGRDESAMTNAIVKGRFEPVVITGSPHGDDLLAPVEDLINRGLHPEARKRPSTKDVFAALLELFKHRPEASAPVTPATPKPAVKPVAVKPVAVKPAPRPEPTRPSPAKPAAHHHIPPAATPARPEVPVRPAAPVRPASKVTATGQQLQLCLDDTPVATVSIDTTIGLPHLRKCHEDARFYAEQQFSLHRTTDSHWTISPVLGATNDTLVDSVKLTAPVMLDNGTRISIGNAAKRIEKLPLVVKIQ